MNLRANTEKSLDVQLTQLQQLKKIVSEHPELKIFAVGFPGEGVAYVTKDGDITKDVPSYLTLDEVIFAHEDRLYARIEYPETEHETYVAAINQEDGLMTGEFFKAE